LFFIWGCHSSPNSKINYPIIWEEGHKLKWSDFKGTAPANPPHTSRSHIKISYNHETQPDTEVFVVQDFFYPEDGFCVKGQESDYLLNHEQRHFDLTEIYARMLRKYLIEFPGHCDLDSFYVAGCDTIYTRCGVAEGLYDTESNHSLNHAIQTEWDNRIDSLLNVYSNYKNPIVKLPTPRKHSYELYDKNKNRDSKKK